MGIRQIFNVIKRRQLIIWAVLAVGLVFMWTFRNAVPSSFAGVSHVVLVSENGAGSVGIVDLPSVATSTVVLERVRNSLHLPVSLISLKANVSASVLGRSSIMAIGFHDASAERAISVTNAVADELSRYYDEISTQRYDVNVNRLSAALDKETKKMRVLDRKMSDVVASNPYVVSEKSIDSITSEIATLDEQRATAAATLEGDMAIADTLAPSATLSKAARHEILADDPAYVAARVAAAKDATQLTADQATYTKSFPGLPGQLAKIKSENDAIHEEVARALRDPDAYSATAASTQQAHLRQVAIVAGDRARLQQLDRLVLVEQQRLKDLPTTGTKYSQLSNERAAMQTEYAALATRRATALANRAEASTLGTVVVLDRALKADTQLAGSRSKAAGTALVLILALAFGLAFLVDSMDPRMSRPEDIEQLYGIPVVATLGAK